MTDQHSVMREALQATPSLTAIGYWLSGKDITFWGGVCGILVLLTQWGFTVWRWRRDIRRDRQGMPVVGDE